MSRLNFSDNLINLRRKKGITQEALATFVGVTKASVSKWETKQSLPDIMLLPQLAVFFDVTIDELLGYEPQLSKEQIKKAYYDLTADFAQRPFEEVMAKCKGKVKKYYSCYPFLFQICVLWLNHFMLAEKRERQLEVLNDASELCSHIISDCEDLVLRNNASVLKATIDLQCGKAEDVIHVMEDILNPYQLSQQGDSVLIQAYQYAGRIEKAVEFTQFSMFSHLIATITSATHYLVIHANEPLVCRETIHRIDKLIEAFNWNQLHPNSSAQFQYFAAVAYCIQQNEKEAFERLNQFVNLSVSLLENDGLFLHDDSYFDKIDRIFEQSDLGISAPRNRKLVFDGIVQSLNNPAFSILLQDEEFERLKKYLIEKGKRLSV